MTLILAQYPSLESTGLWKVWYRWLQRNFEFQAYLLERSSGWVQKLFREAGESWQTGIVLAYGIAQPVLPAALVVPGIAVMRVVGVFRAAGWYALAPLLIYGLVVVLQPGPKERRSQLIWLFGGVWVWIIVAAISGGGDQWDNPRYRTTLIAWEAVLAAWAWWWARTRSDVWLTRWLIVEGLFVLVFTEWYISRYYGLIGRLNFWIMVSGLLGVSALILAGGWFWDRRQRKQLS